MEATKYPRIYIASIHADLTSDDVKRQVKADSMIGWFVSFGGSLCTSLVTFPESGKILMLKSYFMCNTSVVVVVVQFDNPSFQGPSSHYYV